MKTTCTYLFIFLFSCLVARGQTSPTATPRSTSAPSRAGGSPAPADITLADGTVLHEAVVLSVDPASASIRHRSGVARVDLADLPTELRNKISPHFDPQRAQNFRSAEANLDQANAELNEATAVIQQMLTKLDAESVAFSGEITQIVEGGALMKGTGETPDEQKTVRINGADMRYTTKQGNYVSLRRVFLSSEQVAVPQMARHGQVTYGPADVIATPR